MPTPDGCLGTEAEEVGRQQVYYLSQSEGEDLARRPCRLRDCPRHEGTQALRSLWVKRTELLRTGTGGHAGPPGARSHRDVGGRPPAGRRASLLSPTQQRVLVHVPGCRHLPALVAWMHCWPRVHQQRGPHPQACTPIAASEGSPGGQAPPSSRFRSSCCFFLVGPIGQRP